MSRSLALVIVTLLSLAAHPAGAQPLPRTVKIVVPFVAGGGLDILVRVLSESIGKATARRFVVENRPGAGAVIGTEAVARAAPDGATLLAVANAFVTTWHLRPLSYHPLTSFEPICRLVTSSQVIAVAAPSRYRTLGDLIAAAKAGPGELTIASVGPATMQHFAIEMFKRAAGIDLTYVPYGGAGPAVNAVLGSQVTATLTNAVDARPAIAAGTLRALATTSPGRMALLPEVPTVAELGLPFEATGWWGVVAPARTPAAVVAELAEDFAAAMRAPEVAAWVTGQGLDPAVTCGAPFGDLVRAEFEAAGRTARAAGIKAD